MSIFVHNLVFKIVLLFLNFIVWNDIQLHAGTQWCIPYTQHSNLIRVWLKQKCCLTSSALPLGLKSPTARGPQPALTVCTENWANTPTRTPRFSNPVNKPHNICFKMLISIHAIRYLWWKALFIAVLIKETSKLKDPHASIQEQDYIRSVTSA